MAAVVHLKTVSGQRLVPAHAMLCAMKATPQQLIAGFAPGEREYIRRELDQFFSTLPTVAEGFPLRVWRGGQQSGDPEDPAERRKSPCTWTDATRHRTVTAAAVLHGAWPVDATRDDEAPPAG